MKGNNTHQITKLFKHDLALVDYLSCIDVEMLGDAVFILHFKVD